MKIYHIVIIAEYAIVAGAIAWYYIFEKLKIRRNNDTK